MLSRLKQSLQTHRRQWLTFLPLLALLIGLAVVVSDLKNPLTRHDNCTVLATGLKASAYRTARNVLMTNSGQLIHDVALACAGRGVTVINDFDVFLGTVEPRDKARLTHRAYRWLPERWSLEVHRQKPEKTP